MWMTFLAFAGSFGGLGASGPVASSARSRSPLRRALSAIPPRPPAIPPRKRRRSSRWKPAIVSGGFIGSREVEEFIGVEQGPAECRQTMIADDGRAGGALDR